MILRNAVWCDIPRNTGYHTTLHCVHNTGISFLFLWFWRNIQETTISYAAWGSVCNGLCEVYVVALWMGLVVLALQPKRYMGRVFICATVALSRNVVFWWMCSSVHSQYQFHDVSVCNVFSLWPATLLTALHHSSAHNKQHLWLWSWFQPLQCLPCCMLLLWQGTNCTVGWKTDISMN